MKSLHRVKTTVRPGIMASVVLAFIAVGLASMPENPDKGSVSWFSGPKEEPNGWYWMYDDASDPPFEEPLIPPMPAPPYSEYAIHDDPYANQLAPYNDMPFQYALTDSFWYYGYWFEADDYLYISPDGWVSFDNAAASGYPHPPQSFPPFPASSAPNMVIAPLWADYNPTQTTGPVDYNRVYYLEDLNTGQLVVEWYRIQGNGNSNQYTFQLRLQYGGQNLLDSYQECGVVFSHHLINFIYNTTTAGWDAEGAATGIEDPDGLKGITYKGSINTTSDDFHAIRAGYKHVFEHDVAAYAILRPRSTVLRYTPIEPAVMVANLGQETEHFTANLVIAEPLENQQYDTVYNHSLGAYDLLPNQQEILEGPCWTPGDFYKTYHQFFTVNLDRDECDDNNCLTDTTWVSCDDTVRFFDPRARTWYWGGGNPKYWPILPGGIKSGTNLAVFLESEGGSIVSGGRLKNDWLANPYWQVACWQAENGCGLPQEPPLQTVVPEVDTPWCEFDFEKGGLFVPSQNPGNFWVGVMPTSNTNPAWILTTYPLQAPIHPCYGGNGYSRTASSSIYSGWSWPAWISFAEICMEVAVHLGVSEHYAPPCWEGGMHDLICYRFEEPLLEYIESGQEINPKLAVANIGYQAEPDEGFITVKFIAVGPDTSDTACIDSTLIDQIGWLGDDADNPDTVMVSIPGWAPQAYCDDSSSVTIYQLVGLVRLGKIGPDESDHCPYNDTLRKEIQCLFSHDVGIPFIRIDPERDQYPPGTYVRIFPTVENFGYHAEYDVSVDCEIRDVDSSDVLLWHQAKNLEVIDWRGNQLERPYQIEVPFGEGAGWVVPTDHHITVTCRTELADDECPDNDEKVAHLNAGITEGSHPQSFALEVNQTFGTDPCELRFSVPQTSFLQIDVLDVSGRKAATITHRSYQPGRHQLTFDRRDDAGRELSPGIYMIRMQAGTFTSVKKIVLIN